MFYIIDEIETVKPFMLLFKNKWPVTHWSFEKYYNNVSCGHLQMDYIETNLFITKLLF